jgi:hypothetical protein
MNIDTDYKAIGLREIDLKPEVYTITVPICNMKNVGFEIIEDLSSGPSHPKILATDPKNTTGDDIDAYEAPQIKTVKYDWELQHPFEIVITPSNTLEEILNNIVVTFNSHNTRIVLEYLYNPETSELTIGTDSEDTTETDAVKSPMKFALGNIIDAKIPYYANLFKFLNIPESDFLKYHQVPFTKVTIPNVWDRRTLYVHSSIVNTTPYNYLGHAGEFYTVPSKLYKWTSKNVIR